MYPTSATGPPKPIVPSFRKYRTSFANEYGGLIMAANPGLDARQRTSAWPLPCPLATAWRVHRVGRTVVDAAYSRMRPSQNEVTKGCFRMRPTHILPARDWPADGSRAWTRGASLVSGESAIYPREKPTQILAQWRSRA